MSTKWRTSAFTVFFVGLFVATALAAITWHEGPTFTNNGDGTFTLTGDGSGQGNTRLVATIVISGTVRYTCVNKGGNESPGQNPVPATTTGSQDVRPTGHNGRSLVDLTVGPLTPAAVIGGKVAGCPNGNWQGVNPVVEGQLTATATITFGGVKIFEQTISF
jgi:hypothetical protein